MLVNALSMMAPYGPAEKQALLEAPDLKTRAETLIAITEMALAREQRRFRYPACNRSDVRKSMTEIAPTTPKIDPQAARAAGLSADQGAAHLGPGEAELISRVARLAYPVRDGIPIMLPSEARPLAAEGAGPRR